MSAIVLILLAIVIFVVAYNTYGKYLAKAWGLSSQNETPAHTMEDGVDYVPAKTPILLGHHFHPSPRRPINGPIQAALFGWVPVFLWIVIGGIFFGAVQTSAPSSYPSVIRENPWERLLRRTSAIAARCFSPFCMACTAAGYRCICGYRSRQLYLRRRVTGIFPGAVEGTANVP